MGVENDFKFMLILCFHLPFCFCQTHEGFLVSHPHVQGVISDITFMTYSLWYVTNVSAAALYPVLG